MISLIYSLEPMTRLCCSRSSHRRYSVRKGVFRIQENICVRVSFLIKLRALACNFIKKETLTQVFSCEFCETSKNTFFTEHLWATDFAVPACAIVVLVFFVDSVTTYLFLYFTPITLLLILPRSPSSFIIE